MALSKSQTFPLPQNLLSIFQILLAACFMGLCAQIKIPSPFTPVPFTVQTTGVMLIAAFLGSRKGVQAILCYLIQGSIGLPVWAGGVGGFVHFIGPTGGYLMAYLIQVAFIGWAFERRKTLSFLTVASTLLFSICFQLGMGSLWLGQFVGFEKCLTYGFFPFFLSESTKALLTASIIYYSINKSSQKENTDDADCSISSSFKNENHTRGRYK